VAGHGSWLWRFALLGAVVTASLQSIRAEAPLTGTLRFDGQTPTRTVVRVEVRDNVVAHNALATPGALLWTSGDGQRRVVSSSISVRPLWPLVVLGAWLTIAALLTTWFLVARARFLRVIGPRRPADHTLAGNALRFLRAEGHIDRDVRLTISDRLTSPVALGAHEVCLPARALAELDPVRMESILAHELAHLVRRDPTWLTMARLIESVFFFQPLNILARRRMQEAAEFASDAWASTRVARPLDLAHCLARVAEWTIAAPRLPVPAMAERRGKALVRRVERLTTGRIMPETAPSRSARLGAVVAIAGLVFLAPRAAVGADRAIDHMFNARVADPPRVIFLREMQNVPAAGVHQQRLQTIVLRVSR
jgi:beta-lactamase regulating signal transducer with metallopeptidase domain